MQTFGISRFTARGEISPIIDCYFHNEEKPRFSLYVDDCGLIEEVIIKQDNAGIDDAFLMATDFACSCFYACQEATELEGDWQGIVQNMNKFVAIYDKI